MCYLSVSSFIILLILVVVCLRYILIYQSAKITAYSRCSDDVMLIFLADKFTKVPKKTISRYSDDAFSSSLPGQKSLPGQNNFPILELPPCSLDPLSVYCSLLVLLAPENIKIPSKMEVAPPP